MKIWHISDTHSNQALLKIPAGIDVVIHSGDATNYRDPYRNEPEMRAFIDWFASLPIPNKVFVAGNHDTSIENQLPLLRGEDDLRSPDLGCTLHPALR
jgi:3',5'-cyclic AMP phosphodiesterase CpdA